MSPGKQLQLMESALRNGQALCAAPLRIGPVSESPDTPSDRRFSGDGWQRYPFNVWSQAHLQNGQWWRDAMTGVHGVAPPHENLLAFVADLIVDTIAPSNFTLTNPDVISATAAENGQNLIRGAKYLVEDLCQNAGMVQPAGPQAFGSGAIWQSPLARSSFATI